MSSNDESINNDNRTSDIEGENNEILEVGEDLEANEENTEVQREETAEGAGDADKTVVKPKRVIRNPQPKLNEETIKGPRGIAALESYFQRVKFKGKGHEQHDLNAVMKTYEYWCHRLFPKFPFDTCIERLEKLGSKKAVQTHIKRIRFDLLVEDKPIVDSSDEEANVDGFVDIEDDQLNHQFDQLMTSLPSVNPQPTELTDEQMERIKLNKEKAAKVRQEVLRKLREKAEGNLQVSSQLPGTSGIDDHRDDQFDVQSTQSDIFSQEQQEDTMAEPTFDLESNVKGKATVRGSTVKKKSTRKVVNEQDMMQDITNSDIEENPNQNTSVTKKVKKHNALFDSDDEEDNKGTSSYDLDDNTTDDASLSKAKSGHRNIIESEDSDQEMDDFARKSSPVISRVDNLNSKESTNDIVETTKKTKRKVLNILDSDESDLEPDSNIIDSGPSALINEKVNGVNASIENRLNHDSSESYSLELQHETTLALEKASSQTEQVLIDNDEPMEVVEQETVSVLTKSVKVSKGVTDSVMTENSVDNIS